MGRRQAADDDKKFAALRYRRTISVIGHITEDELRARLTRTDVANGFGNRFMFMLVKRSKVLPFGGDALVDEVIFDLGERLKAAVASASGIGRIGWTECSGG